MALRPTNGDEDRRVLWGGPAACGGLSGRVFRGAVVPVILERLLAVAVRRSCERPPLIVPKACLIKKATTLG